MHYNSISFRLNGGATGGQTVSLSRSKENGCPVDSVKVYETEPNQIDPVDARRSLATVMVQTNSFPFQLLIASACATLLVAHLSAADSPPVGRQTIGLPATDSGKKMWLTLLYLHMDIREANSFVQFL
ncbi:MAG TPA: hypothetical protein VN836_06070 [Verrucomicrobiae bacterium]|nr:hypothetical protein [Verrucomicrobiae bacterium]